MGRGRPFEAHDNEKFLEFVCAAHANSGLSIPEFASLVGVDRFNLWRILHNERRCGNEIRARILDRLGAPPEIRARFLLSPEVADTDLDIRLLEWTPCYHEPLEQGINLYIHLLYEESYKEFNRVLAQATVENDPILQADANVRLGWLHFDQDHYDKALPRVRECIRLIENYLHASTNEILNSVQPGTRSTLVLPSDTAAHVLHRALHLWSKILFTQLVWQGKGQGTIAHQERATEELFDQSIILARYLQSDTDLANDLRLKAVLEAGRAEPRLKVADNLLAESREKFVSGSIGEHYCVRDHGMVYLQAGKRPAARRYLLDAMARLSMFANPRALAMTFYGLSNTTIPKMGDDRDARRYALAAAVLYPYGNSAENCLGKIGTGTHRALSDDIQDLLEGKGPFNDVHKVMRRLARGRQNNPPLSPSPLRRPGPPRTVDDLMVEHLSLIPSPRLRHVLNEVHGSRSEEFKDK